MIKRLVVIVVAATVLLLAGAPGVSVAGGHNWSHEGHHRSIEPGLRERPDFSDGDRSHQTDTSTTTDSTSATRSQTYAALGDSVAAGLGLETATDTQCSRSTLAYPYQVADAQNLTLVHVACKGATAGDLFTQQRMRGPNPPPQLHAAFASGTPELITITTGANDTHWDLFLRKCYAKTCGTSRDTRVANTLRNNLSRTLHIAFHKIEKLSEGSPPNVVLTGYYNPLSPACTNVDPRLTSQEIAWLSSRTDALNQTLQDVSAHYSFVTFVPIDFSGHDVCSTHPWVQSLHDPAPFHPTLRGHQEIAQSILQTVHSR